MIRIATTAAAFEAIASTLPLGSVVFEPGRTASGGYFIWLDRSVVNNLERLRRRGEDISDVIVLRRVLTVTQKSRGFSMLKLLLRKRIITVIENEIEVARSALLTMHLLFHKDGPTLTMVYAESIGETAGLLARRFRISVPEALEARALDWRQLDEAYRDLTKAIETMRPHLQSQSEGLELKRRR